MVKKLLMMVAIVALAFGAQADVSYSYQFSLVTIPTDVIKLYQDEMIKNVKCYLCDNGSTGGLQYENKTVMATFGLDSIDVPEVGDVSFHYTPMTYNMAGEQKSDGSSKTAKSGYDKFGNLDIVTLNTDQSIVWKDMGDPNYTKSSSEYMQALNDYVDKNLEALLVGDVYDAEQGKYVTKSFSVDVTVNSGYVGLGSNTSYDAIPEPTSGMLVFLGLAGLMLKRRRAA